MSPRSSGKAEQARHRPERRPQVRPEIPEPDPSPLSPRAAAGVVVALLAVWCLTFAPQLTGRATFVRGDAGQFSAFSEFSRAEWRQFHRRTFWNPYVFLGLPSVASLADGRPQWLPGPLLDGWDALTRTRGGSPLGPPLAACLVGALAAAWLARSLWGCGPAAMAMAGAGWLLAPGLLVPLGFGHDAQTTTLALLPATLLAAERVLAVKAGRPLRFSLLALSLVAAWQVLGGHPQFVVYTGVALAAMLIGLAAAPGRARRLWLVAGALAFAAALSAVLWWPALLYSTHTQRTDPAFAAREARIWSLLPRDLLSLAWPRAVGYADAAYSGGMRATDYSHASGLAAVVLALVGLSWGGKRARLAPVLAGLAILAMLLALGRNLPIVGALFQALPVIGTFRTPMTWLVLAHLAIVLVAARGFERCFGPAAPSRLRAAAGVGLGAALLVVLMTGPLGEQWLDWARHAQEDRLARHLVRDQAALERFVEAGPAAAAAAVGDLALELAVASAVLGLAAWGARAPKPAGRATASAVAAGLVVLPLALLSWPALRAASGEPSTLAPAPPPPLAAVAARDPLHRAAWFDRGGAPSKLHSLHNAWVGWRARQLAGLASTVPAAWDRAANLALFATPAFLRACAVRYVALPDSISGEDRVSEWTDALPRAYAVPEVRAVADEAALAEVLRSPGWDPLLLACAIGGSSVRYPGSPGLVVRWVRDEPDALEWRLRAGASAFLVVADLEFPGWSARLDDRPVEIRPVDLLFRGVQIPPGEHRLSMRYGPPGWWLGAWITRWGALAWLGALALAGWPARRVPAED